MTFNHEKLQVYQRTLAFNARVSAWIVHWDSRHSIYDHLPRAAGSVLENIAMSSAAYSSMKVKCLDYAIGSTLECAACLDIAGIKMLMEDTSIVAEKEELSQLLKMLIGLRRSWLPKAVREDQSEYGDEEGGGVQKFRRTRLQATEESSGKSGQTLFHHEKLDVYSVALEVVERFSSSASVQSLSSSMFRRLDVLATSMVLNIAEGNGRFSALDQRRFLGTSHEAAVKLAARLDLCVAQRQLPREEAGEIKLLLLRVSVMASAMIS